MTEAQEAAHLRARYHYSVLRDDAQVMVELHWAFARRYWGLALDMAHVQERCITTSLTGTAVRTLSAEDLLLILTVHGAKHYWPRLGWICDVAALLHRQPALDWEQVIAQARALGVRRILWLGLLLAHNVCGATLPPRVQQLLQADLHAGLLATQISQRLFARQNSHSIDRQQHDFYFHMRERRRERVLYLFYQLRQYGRQAFTPTATEHALLPSSLAYLRPLLRLLRVAGKYGWRAPRHLLFLLWHGIRSQ
jgi:hypothetical protein